jgi:hypothetical protein
MGKSPRFITNLIVLASALTLAAVNPAPLAQTDDPNPPDQVVKLVFIHHSTGENWLADGYGDLGRALDQNNYFVSDTNYGWGPDSIGDRTDIPDWIEWFSNENTYTQALYQESEQHADYTRTLADPGGENQVILFKSCFPNSELEGSPDDPPGTYEELSVAGAKYVYNQILGYFATRPDKLFIVITAPPLSDDTYAANARAFDQWLVEDWLTENQYTLNNVAVFDFYNVLTDPDSHHRTIDGRIEHTIGGGDTLYYPSDDDHPSEAGSRKATEEFVPLLNVFYHRWQDSGPSQPVVAEPVTTELDEQEGVTPEVDSPPAAGLIDDFESGLPAGTSGWEAYWDETTASTMRCHTCSSTTHSGNKSFKIDFNVAPESWGTCALFYDNAQNWSASPGITFYLHAAQTGSILDIDLYVDGPGGQESYIARFETTPQSVENWVPVSLAWNQFQRVDWEAEAGTPFDKADQVSGLAFGFSPGAEGASQGAIWVDDLALAGTQLEAGDEEPAESAPEPVTEEVPQDEPARSLPCLGALALPLGLAVFSLSRRRF